MNYDEQYNFCWPNEGLWLELVDAIAAADGQAIAMLVEAQYTEIGPDVRQFDGIATDLDIGLVTSPDLDLIEAYPVGEEQFAEFNVEEEHVLLETMAGMRDRQLSSLPDEIPETVRTLSWFLRDTQVRSYASGKNFGGSREHVRVYRGLNPRGVLTTGPMTKIRTGRDMASLVHTDNPVEFGVRLISDLQAEGVMHRLCPGMVDTPGLQRFASVGNPFLFGAPGEILRRVGLISFRTKWQLMERRPAQVLADDYGRFLPWAFPEAHPSHPSRNAMHFIVYAAIGGYVKYMYNSNHVLPSGNTVEREVDLWVGNMGDGRMWPGVHTRLDHEPYRERAEALGVRIAEEHIGGATA